MAGVNSGVGKSQASSQARQAQAEIPLLPEEGWTRSGRGGGRNVLLTASTRVNTSMRFYNSKRLSARRLELRRNLTTAEAALWKRLQRRQLAGRKFRRQHGVGPYILDFFCPESSLAVELDGAAHDNATAQTRDRRREEFLRQARIQVLRFENREVIENMEGVLIEIKRSLLTPTIPSPLVPPLLRQEGKVE